MQLPVQRWGIPGGDASLVPYVVGNVCAGGDERPDAAGSGSQELQEVRTVGSAGGAIKGSHVGELPRKSRQYANDRVCAHPGCITKISRYNRRETCFAHAGVKIPRLRGRKVASV